MSDYEIIFDYDKLYIAYKAPGLLPKSVIIDSHDDEAPLTYVPKRTCKMINNGVELCCSRCDCRHDYDDNPNFCMCCGAKVIQ